MPEVKENAEVEVKETESTIVISSSEDDAKVIAGVGEEAEAEQEAAPEGETPKDEPKENGHSEPRKKNSAKKRIQGLVRDNKSKDETIAELQKKLDERDEKPEGQGYEGADGEPNIDDYDTFSEYEEALKAHEGKEAQVQEKDEPKGGDDIQVKAQEAYQELDPMLDDARDKHEDFQEVIGNDELQITVELMNNLTAFEDNAGEILYDLAKHDPDKLAEISALPYRAQIRELIKVEDNLGKPKKAPVKKHSEAPEPINVLEGGGAEVKSLDDDDLSFEEHQKLLNSQKVHARGGFL